ncbi:hypothetical protein T10_376 [Trichinella papuae]|uniref:Integrase p58-like C-terminal domain-containing protein n=1 Tax=Trichinella papuae TaxID=268474 RepID=A0A0V1M3K9_9BILA|nr:hypothetical protein T10_376 [Trichinella papuae]
MKTQQRRQKCLHDRHVNETRFRLNDRVWLAMPKRGKLDRGWEGPHRLVEVIGPQTYRVRHQERKRRTLVVHSDRMKRHHGWYGKFRTNYSERWGSVTAAEELYLRIRFTFLCKRTICFWQTTVCEREGGKSIERRQRYCCVVGHTLSAPCVSCLVLFLHFNLIISCTPFNNGAD